MKKIEKDKNCLQQSAISSNVNMVTEMVTAAKELRTLNYNFIIIIIIIRKWEILDIAQYMICNFSAFYVSF